MDLTAAKNLFLCSKNPLGRVGDVIFKDYLEDKRAFALSHRGIRNYVDYPWARGAVLVPPMDRCKERRGRGRCRGRVSGVAVCQFCAYHQERLAGDKELDEWRTCVARARALW